MLQASTIDIFRTIIKTEGVQGLYKGIPSQMFRTVLATALMLATKERITHATAKYLPLIVFALANPAMASQIIQAQLRTKRRRA